MKAVGDVSDYDRDCGAGLGCGCDGTLIEDEQSTHDELTALAVEARFRRSDQTRPSVLGN